QATVPAALWRKPVARLLLQLLHAERRPQPLTDPIAGGRRSTAHPNQRDTSSRISVHRRGGRTIPPLLCRRAACLQHVAQPAPRTAGVRSARHGSREQRTQPVPSRFLLRSAGSLRQIPLGEAAGTLSG